MKMKEFGPPGGGASLAPPLDPPMKTLMVHVIYWSFAEMTSEADNMCVCERLPVETRNVIG